MPDATRRAVRARRSREPRALAGSPILRFRDRKTWLTWLDTNHAKSAGIWLGIAKKASGVASVSYDQAVEGALCYGWIDGQKRPLDGTHWLQRFTPRRAGSVWSRINKEKALRLIESGKMKPAGRKAIEVAKQNGLWNSAYEPPTGASVPDDLRAALNRNAKAKAFFAVLDRPNRYAILFRIQTARKPETRARRVQQYVRMLERKEKIHP